MSDQVTCWVTYKTVIDRDENGDPVEKGVGDLLEISERTADAFSDRLLREGEVDATDSAIELALKNGLDVGSIDGSGEDGRVLKKDVTSLIEGDNS